MNANIAIISLYADDLDAAVAFYQQVIGLHLVSPRSRPAEGGAANWKPHFRLGGAYLVFLLGKPQPPLDAAPGRFPVLALAVDDLDGAIQRLNRAGVDLPWGAEADARARWVMFPDPAGNLIELVQSLPGAI